METFITNIMLLGLHIFMIGHDPNSNFLIKIKKKLKNVLKKKKQKQKTTNYHLSPTLKLKKSIMALISLVKNYVEEYCHTLK